MMALKRQAIRFASRRDVALLRLYASCFLLLFVAACAPAAPATLQGTDLQKLPAPDFQLRDANDQPFALSAQKGRVVVLTFLYTHCPDECPLIADHLRDAHEKLGADAASVRFIAVSLDPENDSAAAIRQFVSAHKVEDVLTYLRGTREQLAPVWKAYFLSVLPGSNPNTLAHQSRIVVIDRNNMQRSNFGADFDTDALVNDVRIVLADKS